MASRESEMADETQQIEHDRVTERNHGEEELSFEELIAGEDDVRTFFFFSSRRRHTRYIGDWSSDVCSSDLRLYQLRKIIVIRQLILIDASLAEDQVEDDGASPASPGVLSENPPEFSWPGPAEIGRASCRGRV